MSASEITTVETTQHVDCVFMYEMGVRVLHNNTVTKNTNTLGEKYWRVIIVISSL
jgi:hypothetical protein